MPSILNIILEELLNKLGQRDAGNKSPFVAQDQLHFPKIRLILQESDESTAAQHVLS